MLPGWRMVVMPSSGKPDAAAQQAIDQHNSDIDYIIQSLPARAGDNRRNTCLLYTSVNNHQKNNHVRKLCLGRASSDRR